MTPTITEEAVEAAPWNLIKRVPLPIGRAVIVGKWFTRPDGYVIWDQEIYVAHDAGWRAEWGDDKPTHWMDAPDAPGTAAAPLMFPVQTDEVKAAVERVREMIAELSHNDTVVMSPGIAESHARDLETLLAALNTEAGSNG